MGINVRICKVVKKLYVRIMKKYRVNKIHSLLAEENNFNSLSSFIITLQYGWRSELLIDFETINAYG